MFRSIPMATAQQIQEARRLHDERVEACKLLDVEPPSFYSILTEVMNSPAGSLESRPLTSAQRRLGTTFQSYPQYKSPRKENR